MNQTQPAPATHDSSFEYDPLEEGLFVDMAHVLSLDLSEEVPSVAPVLDGHCMLYAGRVNELHAEPGVGKTNVVLALAVSVLAQGKTVAYIDPEDSPKLAVRRLLRFGATREQILAGFKYAPCPTPENWSQLTRWARVNRPDFLAFDGLAEILASFGVNENDHQEFLSFCRDYITPLATLGICVLVSDHVAKKVESDQKNKTWARGSSAKLGRYDGASYVVELGQGYSPTVAGYVRLHITKDRHGGVGCKFQYLADIHFTPDPENQRTQVEFRLASPNALPASLEPVMDKITRHLTAHPDACLRDLIALGGKSSNIHRAIDALQKAGRLLVESSGPGKANRYTLLDPTAGEDPEPLREADLPPDPDPEFAEWSDEDFQPREWQEFSRA
ncbi:hypothetical protein BH09VER1_BH09VER1_40290 [soil metagenome]